MPTKLIPIGGMDNLSPSHRIPFGKARNVVNCDFNLGGQLIIPRPGCSRVYAGTACHSWYEYEHPYGLGFFVENGVFKRLNRDFSTTALLGAGAAKMYYASLGATLYLSNGVFFKQYASGSLFDVGVEVPGYQPKTTVTQTGGLYAGKYKVAITWLRNGEQSGAVTPVVVDVPEGGGIQLTEFPVVPPTVDVLFVYVSDPNGADLLFYGAYPRGTPEVKVDYFTGADPLTTIGAVRARPKKHLAVHNGRLWWADGTQVFASEPFQFGLYRAFNCLPFPDEPTNIISVSGVNSQTLFVTTRAEIYRVDATSTEVPVPTVVRNYGCPEGGAAYSKDGKEAYVVSDNGLLMITQEGVAELMVDSVATHLYDEATLAVHSREGYDKVVFTGVPVSAGLLQHSDYSADEIARKGNNL